VRRLLITIAALTALLATAGTAFGHAYLVSTLPSGGAKLAASPAVVTLTFNEPIQLLRGEDADVVNEEGAGVSSGPPRRAKDARVLEIPLRPSLPNGTYTVRYSVIGADSHVIPSVYVFGIGPDDLKDPNLAGSGGGPSETSVWGVSSRFLEMVGLGGLIGLLAFRWLVWGPALRRVDGVARNEGEAALAWGRDSFWVGFGMLAVGAMLAEGYLLVVQSASVLGTGVFSALRDAAGISQVLADTRFGSLVQLRGALLFLLFAIGALMFIREYGSTGVPKAPTGTGSRTAATVMTALLATVLWGIAAQGHASVNDLSGLQVSTQLVHIIAGSVWIVGLAMVALVHLRLPKVAARSGGALAARVLARFSKVALVAVAVVVLTGVIRSLGELSDPAELWQTAYGRSILYKVALLVPIGALALYNRRIIVALRDVARPNGPTLALVRRMAGAELALSLVIVVVASILVAQVPPVG
jgi:copper transport protein